MVLRSTSVTGPSEPQPGTSKEDDPAGPGDDPPPAPQHAEESRTEALQTKVIMIYIYVCKRIRAKVYSFNIQVNSDIPIFHIYVMQLSYIKS